MCQRFQVTRGRMGDSLLSAQFLLDDDADEESRDRVRICPMVKMNVKYPMTSSSYVNNSPKFSTRDKFNQKHNVPQWSS